MEPSAEYLDVAQAVQKRCARLDAVSQPGSVSLNIMNAVKFAGREPYFSGHGVMLFYDRFEEILPEIGSDTVDSLITDPPYAITNLAWDKPVDWSIFWNDAMRICRPHAPIVLFASGKFVPRLINSNTRYYRYDLVWEKNLPVGHLDANKRPLRSHESILVFSKKFRGSRYNPQMVVGRPHIIDKGNPNAHYGKSSGKVAKRSTDLYHPRSVLRFNNSRAGKSLHPTQKPLDLMKWLILSFSDRNDLVLDPFAGSGSTLAAAAHHGRRAIGIEESEEYCEIIARRLECGD